MNKLAKLEAELRRRSEESLQEAKRIARTSETGGYKHGFVLGEENTWAWAADLVRDAAKGE